MPQQPQKPPLPPNTDMMLRALQSQDPRVIKAAMNQMPEELFPNRGEGSTAPHYTWAEPKSEKRDPLSWREKVIVRPDGSHYYTGIFERIKPDAGNTTNVSVGGQIDLVNEWKDANQRATKASELYNRMSGLDLGSGGTEVAANFFRKMFGANSNEDVWRTEVARILNLQVLDLLPKGPASDKDVHFASKGVEWLFSNPKALAYALKGAEKLARADAKLNELIMMNQNNIAGAMEQFREWATSPGGIFKESSEEELAALEAQVTGRPGGNTPTGVAGNGSSSGSVPTT
jgi:hypothetical protein